jgi:hypothetical protein
MDPLAEVQRSARLPLEKGSSSEHREERGREIAATESSSTRRLIELPPAPFFAERWTAILLGFAKSTTIRELLLALIEDYRLGLLSGYANPRLATFFDAVLIREYPLPFGHRHLTNIAMADGPDSFRKLLDELYDSVRRNALHPTRFTFGDNWEGEGQFDTLISLYKPREGELPPQLIVTARTRTDHLAPFVSARIEGNAVVLSRDGVEVDRMTVKRDQEDLALPSEVSP